LLLHREKLFAQRTALQLAISIAAAYVNWNNNHDTLSLLRSQSTLIAIRKSVHTVIKLVIVLLQLEDCRAFSAIVLIVKSCYTLFSLSFPPPPLFLFLSLLCIFIPERIKTSKLLIIKYTEKI